MIDFNYTAPELLPFRIQEVLDAPNEPHRIGGMVYVPEGGWECEPTEEYACSACGQNLVACDVSVGPNGGAIELDPPILFNYCPNCGRKAVKR